MDKIHIKLLTEEKKQIWDDFVDDSNNGTIFHKQKFLSYHKNKFKDNEHHLLFYQGKKLISVLPLAIFESEGGKIAKSPYGASFGGFVDKKAIYSDISRIVKTFKEYAIENNYSTIIITLPPLTYNQQPNNSQDFCLLKERFQLNNRELTSIIPLYNESSTKIFDSYKYSCRRKIRKAIKNNFITKNIENMHEFYDLLLQNHNKFKKTPTHSFDELRELKKLFPEDINIFGVYSGNELTAGVLCISMNNKVVLSFYICHQKQFDNYGVTALALNSAIIWASENGFKFFDLGTSSLNMVANEGLLSFKESFGSTAIFRDTYTLEL